MAGRGAASWEILCDLIQHWAVLALMITSTRGKQIIPNDMWSPHQRHLPTRQPERRGPSLAEKPMVMQEKVFENSEPGPKSDIPNSLIHLSVHSVNIY